MIRFSNALIRLCIGVAGLALLSGCAAFVLGGAATTATVATDRRTTGEQVDDQTIELRVASEMEKEFGDKARTNSLSYAGKVLIVGDVPSAADVQKASNIVLNVPQVHSVANFLQVGDPAALGVRSNDTWITSKVKSQMIATKGVPFRTIKVMTERGVVYLMGKVTKAEADDAARVAASINGVNKVVKLFDIVTPQEIEREYSDTPDTQPVSGDRASN